MIRVVGLDLSLRATGVADGRTPFLVSSKLSGLERLCELRDVIERGCEATIVEMPDDGSALGIRKADLVVIEDYAFSRGDAHAHALGELGGVVKVALREAGFRVVLVGPAALKKFATDKGNANKLAMGIAASKAGYAGPTDDNCIDAWWLRQMGLYAIDVPEVMATAYRNEAVSKVTWPTMPGSFDFEAPPTTIDTAAL